MDGARNVGLHPLLPLLSAARAIRHWILWSCRVALALMMLLGTYSCTTVQLILSPGVSRLSNIEFREIAWAPDGETILALSIPAAPGSENNIFSVSFPSGDINMIPFASNEFSLPSWSPSGLNLAITIGLDSIWLLDPIEGSSLYLTQGEAATWAKDGKQLIVYTGNLTDQNASGRQLRIGTLDDSVKKTIPLGEMRTKEWSSEYISGLNLSGDGSRAVYSIWIPQAGPNIHEAFVVDIVSGTVSRFQPNEQIGQMVWAPDGKSIAYIRFINSDYLGELVIADPAGTCLFKPLLPSKIRSISWSPDGSMIAFSSYGGIYVLDLLSTRQGSQQGDGC
jgi:Tol biopolymer transport system component